jgi:aspartyl-tRNA(Asn)/glutamyl-tRNA(Gln) amidotransferase subunit A
MAQPGARPEIAFLPASEQARLVRASELSPLEVVDAALARIEALDPRVNAFTELRADLARAEARALGERIARGDDPGPLAGLPIGVKDLEDVAGMRTTYGSVPFRDRVARRDSVQVARLRAAGAIVVGKTNTPEFGSTAFTKNRVHGTSRNPWNLDRTPGGSSGGSAAAVAAGMVPLATGSDGGGSIRIPAAYTGLYGIKCSFGRIPRGPEERLTWIDTVSVGPLARTVLDAALYVDATAGYHGCDPTSLPAPAVKYAELIDRVPRGLRIAWSPTIGYAVVARDVARVAEDAALAFRDLGHDVVPWQGAIPDLGRDWGLLSGAETYGEIAEVFERHRDDWGRAFARGLEIARDRLTPASIAESMRKRALLNEAVEAIFATHDLLLTPTLPTTAFPAGGPPPSTIEGVELASPMSVVAFTYPFNLTGHPAATVRAGFGDDGLPVGLQIVAPRHRDDLVFQASRALEQVRPWNDRWPDLAL